MDVERRVVGAAVLALVVLFELDASQIDVDSRLQAIEDVEFELGQMDAGEVREFRTALDGMEVDGSGIVESLRHMAEPVAERAADSAVQDHRDLSDRLVSVLLAPCRVLFDLEPPLIDARAQAEATSRIADELRRLGAEERRAVLAALDRLEVVEPSDAPFLGRLRDRLILAS
ncbi:hypothetical protein ABT369_56770 [Dactylosporangium sp. NPDC000244]|uniref:hypothetical protein n=1 Tax=Dactylosporangium sp. NPDC000244 TaxID=3154365 RepID=UPI00332B706D